MNKIIGVIVIILVVIGGVYLYNQNTPSESETNPDENDSAEETQNDTPASVPAEWETYTNDSFDFTFRYPENAEVSTENGRVKVQVIGPDSEPATEITDGYTFYGDKRMLEEGQTLVDVAENQYEEQSQGNTGVESPKEVEIAGKTAQVFIVQNALGSNTTYAYVAGEGGSVYETIYTVSDPNGEDYQSDIFAMIGTLEDANNVEENGDSSEDTVGAGQTSEVEIAFLDSELSEGEEADRGCDKIVTRTREIESTQAPLTAALQELFSLEQEEVGGNTNFIARTNDTLSFDRAVVENGTANIYLTGELSGLRGVCDNPRARIQIEETALQFQTVDNVEIFLNGESSELQPDGRGMS